MSGKGEDLFIFMLKNATWVTGAELTNVHVLLANIILTIIKGYCTFNIIIQS